ncbi:MAG: leucyl aminopeptidase [Deltaproteobacteria bacterium]|nr:leucyl aminopeptidase [Candidatus Anaeroferrophillus wilburensis]MBN2889071.1 leucyl aminopeptidase [Deltaproteobacteria bacterium]
MDSTMQWQVRSAVPLDRQELRVYLLADDRQFFAADDRLLKLRDVLARKEIKKAVFVAGEDLSSGDYLIPLQSFSPLNIWESVKAAAAQALGVAREMKLSGVTLVLDAPDALGFHKKALEGIMLGGYRFATFKKEAREESLLPEITFVVGALDAVAINADLQRTEKVCATVNRVRHLVDQPAANLGPEELTAACLDIAKRSDLLVEVWDESRLRREGYAGLLAVGRGSERPPRMVQLQYHPAGESRFHVALVGKGITFDSGGISLKPSASMEEMKRDMAGAAAVIGAMEIIAALKPSVSVTGIVVLAENMPDARAQRPGDVLVMKNGTSVEVKNTDAEGRLVLVDGILRAVELNPDYLLDIATLTGACLVALGTRIAGVLGEQKVVDRLCKAGENCGEMLWQLPLEQGYKEDLKSDIADLANVGSDRYAGTIRGALFLQEFVPPELPWAHLDIAGPSFVNKKWKYFAPGATGFGARVLAGFVKNL